VGLSGMGELNESEVIRVSGVSRGSEGRKRSE